MLKAWFHVIGNMTRKSIPCLASPWLLRECWDVENQIERLQLSHLEPMSTTSTDPIRVDKNNMKSIAHVLQIPCRHEGPCSVAAACKCAEEKHFCSELCLCPSKCPFRFKGCNCKPDTTGKCCQILNRKDRVSNCPCQTLQRECTPGLCTSCGSKPRADPQNRNDEKLHATGCQNVVLQRGKTPILAPGESQLDGVGFGLYTLVDIPRHTHIIEYVGELIDADAGDQREERRGNIFQKGNQASYLFEIIRKGEDGAGLWSDAARLGNVSRYINHASGEKSNAAVQVVLVNGCPRISLFARRHIRAGEELFYNYGEYFPNLDKELGHMSTSMRRSLGRMSLGPMELELDNDSSDENEAAAQKRAMEELAAARKKRRKGRNRKGDGSSESDPDFAPVESFRKPVSQDESIETRRITRRNKNSIAFAKGQHQEPKADETATNVPSIRRESHAFKHKSSRAMRKSTHTSFREDTFSFVSPFKASHGTPRVRKSMVKAAIKTGHTPTRLPSSNIVETDDEYGEPMDLDEKS